MFKHDTSRLSALDQVENSFTASGVTYGSSAYLSTNSNTQVSSTVSAGMGVSGAPRLLASSAADSSRFLDPAGATFTLSFNEAVVAGSGYLYLTDGVAQTVIDRVTGKPGMRIVGATDTQVIDVNDASKVSIANGIVTVHSGALKADRSYKVFIAKGAFEDTTGNAFAGVTSGSAVSFHTNAGPSATIALDKTVAGVGGTIGVTVTFSEAVQGLKPEDFQVAHGTLGAFTSNFAKTVWTSTFTQSGVQHDLGNVISLSTTAVRDLAGNAGSGVATSANYVIDLEAPTIVGPTALVEFIPGAALSITFSEAVYWEDETPMSLTLGEEINTIHRSEVSYSNDHKTIIIPASALALVAGREYTLHLPASMHDAGANAPSQTVLTLDTTPPLSTAVVNPVINIIESGWSDSDGITNQDFQTISGTYTGELASGESIRLLIKDQVFTATVNPANHSWSYTNLMAAGAQSVSAFVTNGWAESEHVTRSYRIDTSPHRATVDRIVTGVEAAAGFTLEFNEALYWTGNAALTFSGNGQTLSFTKDDLGFDNGSTSLSIPASLHGMIEGLTYILSLPEGLTDAAGNEAPTSYTLDTTDASPKATAAYVTSPAGNYGVGDIITIVVRFSEAVWVEGEPSISMYTGGDLRGAADYDSGAGTRDLVFKYQIGEGDYVDEIALADADLAGKVRNEALLTVEEDGIMFNSLQPWDRSSIGITIEAISPGQLGAPDLKADSDTGRSSSDNITADRTPTFTGSGAEFGAMIHLLKDGVPVAIGAADGEGEWSLTALSLESGSYDFSVVQYDSFGNVSTQSTSLAVTIDAKGPSKVNNGVSNSVLSLVFDENVRFEQGEIYIYNSAGQPIRTITPGDASSWSIPEHDKKTLQLFGTGLENGEYTVRFAANTLQDESNNFTELVGDTGVSWLIGMTL